MSAPVARTPRTSGGSPQGTRQQLDELDALLQRMLTLPVNQAEESAPVGVAPEEETPAEEEWIPPPRPRSIAPAPRLVEPAPRPTPPPMSAQQPPTPRPAPQPPQRSYPASYMVVETATPPFFDPPTEPNHPGLDPRLVGVPHQHQPTTPYSFPPPVPGGRHELVEDTPIDPIAEVARAELSMPEEGGEWVPLQSSWQPSAQTWKPLVETWESTRANTPARPTLPEPPMMPTPPRPSREMPVWRDNVIPPAPPGYEEMQRSAFSPPKPMAPVAPPPPVQPEPPAPVEPAPLGLAPVVWFNKGFDLLLVPFGPLGEWFRGASGRTVLGTMGLLCLAGAIVLAVAEGFGWTR